MIGFNVGCITIAASGFIIGGLERLSPCCRSVNFLDGALFGVLAFFYAFGLPVTAAGVVIGAVVAAILKRWHASPRATALVAIATTVAFVAALILIFAKASEDN
jgi:hypothetical protein